jgi:hypothetical protein
VTGVDIAAIVGAAAWLPQIIGWIQKSLAKPILRLIPAAAPEIGFTSFGPILNLTCAFTTARKNAIINDIRVKLKHENGETLALQWNAIVENKSETYTAAGQTETEHSLRSVLALKVTVDDFAERLMRFWSTTFRLGFADHWRRLRARRDALERNEADIERVKHLVQRSDEYSAVVDFCRGSFYWREGSYDVEVAVYCEELKKPLINNFTFTLYQPDVQALRANLTQLEEGLMRMLFGNEFKETFPWNWQYPIMQKRDATMNTLPRRT